MDTADEVGPHTPDSGFHSLQSTSDVTCAASVSSAAVPSATNIKQIGCCAHPSTSRSYEEPSKLPETVKVLDTETRGQGTKRPAIDTPASSVIKRRRKRYQCEWSPTEGGTCPATYEDYSLLCDHVVAMHVERLPRDPLPCSSTDSDDDEPEFNPWQCRFQNCRHFAPTKKQPKDKIQWLREHLLSRHMAAALPHLCQLIGSILGSHNALYVQKAECGERFRQEKDLIEHLMRDHIEKPEPLKKARKEVKKRRYATEWCPERYIPPPPRFSSLDNWMERYLTLQNRVSLDPQAQMVSQQTTKVAGARKRKTFQRTVYKFVVKQDEEMSIEQPPEESFSEPMAVEMSERIEEETEFLDDTVQDVVHDLVQDVIQGVVATSEVRENVTDEVIVEQSCANEGSSDYEDRPPSLSAVSSNMGECEEDYLDMEMPHICPSSSLELHPTAISETLSAPLQPTVPSASLITTKDNTVFSVATQPTVSTVASLPLCSQTTAVYPVTAPQLALAMHVQNLMSICPTANSGLCSIANMIPAVPSNDQMIAKLYADNYLSAIQQLMQQKAVV